MKILLVIFALLVVQYAQGTMIPSSLKLFSKSRLSNNEELQITAAVMPGDPLITGWNQFIHTYLLHSYFLFLIFILL